ncbi:MULTISPECIES: hypothetical protein [Acinetobacter]|jgi:hypothetical protein|uniref:Uncharacterized protein n=8 Tax=Acinetobacter TaxID=469 RepID=N9EHV2_ACIBZ|nr:MULTISPECIES: hypothetical protein [Acinetobacter]MBJ9954257.1 hypothetical protein [Acinetobacter baumannii]ELW77276.1 hypothetical protein ACINWC743_2846 [Acinetobacter sp. WC-743]ENV94519.1 hypothetical protein F938_02704 [Acinetobacter bereziniae LMG 1003 = CIP 70.12]KKW75266.1 hypothetical protein AAV97_19480 [Acinetobacter sp. Ag2]MBI0393770.1 hypothetical protein [Acinetobacter bereziniae]
MNDLIKVREVLKNIQNQHNKNRAISLVGMVDLNELDITWLIEENYIEIDDAISYLDNKNIVFIKDLTFKGKKLLYQLSV